MGASNTPLYDLVELQGLLENTTYTTTPGGGGDIIGLVDNATYTDSHSGNTPTTISELNETYDADAGFVTIDGVDYIIELVTPANNSNPVTITYDGGASTIDVYGDAGTSKVAFIVASPLGGGSTRWFMALDDTLGDLPDITAVETRALDWNPAGDDVKINLDQNNNLYVCFAAGTLIETEAGPRPVEQIEAGERVLTLDNGLQPVLWARGQTVRFDDSDASARQRPIRIRRGALGPGLPRRELTVSPQHRVLLASKITARLCAASEVLVPAVKLLEQRGIARQTTGASVHYVHLFFARHEIVLAEGAPAESLLMERGTLRSLPRQDRAALRAVAAPYMAPARPIIEDATLLKHLLRRHRRNHKPLCDPGVLERAEREADAAPLRLVHTG